MAELEGNMIGVSVVPRSFVGAGDLGAVPPTMVVAVCLFHGVHILGVVPVDHRPWFASATSPEAES